MNTFIDHTDPEENTRQEELITECEDYVVARLTRYDCDKWHSGGGMSRNVTKLLKFVREKLSDPEAILHIWGMPDPVNNESELSVEIH